ncbi:MAG: FAD-binding oxidoreductase [Arenicellales bacterium]|nr:FAD-binding oxidoreductase [Arenicellales bacterium]
MVENNECDSVWKLTAGAEDSYPELEGDTRSDVVIVGGGFCGLSAAIHLVEAGCSVAVLEANVVGWGASGRNGGQVIPGLKLDPDDLVSLYGPQQGEALVDLTGKGPDLVFSLIDRYAIKCDARRTGWIQLAAGPNRLKAIISRVRQLQERGADINSLDQKQVQQYTGSTGYIGGLIDARGGNVNPLAYVRGLAKAAKANNVEIYIQSRVASLQQESGLWIAHTQSGRVMADKALLCTNAYTDEVWPKLKRTVIPFVSGAVATAPLPNDLRANILKEGQAAADNSRLLSWFGLDRDGRLIFGGRTGSWSETNNPSDYENRVERMHQVFPQVKGIPVERYWSGKVALTTDSLPHIYELRKNLYAGLGFNGRGVAMATLMGKLLAQRCIDANQPVFPSSDFKPIPMHALRKPLVQAVVHWKKVLDRVHP